ncbi:MAG: ABC transporter ATP-binding protein [Chloroflexota bacterium]
MIVVDDVTKRFSETTAVQGVSFEIPQGEIAILLGPSGSGKTTLLHLIAGLLPLDEGEIHLNGTLASNPSFNLPPFKRDIGFVFQSPALWPHMTVAQNILFGLANLSTLERQERLKRLLGRTNIGHLADRYPHEISGGEARRVAVVRALAPEPRILLMDEPLTNLDPDLHTELMALIREHVQATGTTLLYVTHRADEAEQLAQRRLHLHKGCLITDEGRKDPTAARSGSR